MLARGIVGEVKRGLGGQQGVRHDTEEGGFVRISFTGFLLCLPKLGRF